MQRLRNLFCTVGLLTFLFGGCGKQPAPQNTTPPQRVPLFYSQLDITERFYDHLKPDDWIQTVPLNKALPNGKGFPPVGTRPDEIFKGAERLSKMRESISTQTVPLNKPVVNGKGLPPVGASADEIFKAAERLSKMRESISIPTDGVYCPVCHIANTQLAKLRTPCPKCGRPLLRFGWD